jgi:hypothetical protein
VFFRHYSLIWRVFLRHLFLDLECGVCFLDAFSAYFILIFSYCYFYDFVSASFMTCTITRYIFTVVPLKQLIIVTAGTAEDCRRWVHCFNWLRLLSYSLVYLPSLLHSWSLTHPPTLSLTHSLINTVIIFQSVVSSLIQKLVRYAAANTSSATLQQMELCLPDKPSAAVMQASKHALIIILINHSISSM